MYEENTWYKNVGPLIWMVSNFVEYVLFWCCNVIGLFMKNFSPSFVFKKHSALVTSKWLPACETFLFFLEGGGGGGVGGGIIEIVLFQIPEINPYPPHARLKGHWKLGS